MAKKTVECMPVRLHKSTLKRIDKHLDKTKFKVVGTRVVKKNTLNEFIEMCLDAYEMFRDSKVYYTNELLDDLAEARGQAILKATKTKQPVKMPTKVVIVGEDSL